MTIGTVTIDEIAIAYGRLFREFVPHYYRYISHWKHKYDANNITFDIGVSDNEWTFDAHVFEDDSAPNNYKIELSIGIFIRLACLLHELIEESPDLLSCAKSEKRAIAVVVRGFEDAINIAPDGGIFDDDNDSTKRYYASKFHPIFFTEESSRAQHAALSEHWNFKCTEVILSREFAIPVFWMIDFIVYHEISHVLLRHFTRLGQKKGRFGVSEACSVDQTLHNNRQLAEFHADNLAMHLLVNSLPGTQAAT